MGSLRILRCDDLRASDVAPTIGILHILHRNNICLQRFQLCIQLEPLLMQLRVRRAPQGLRSPWALLV